mmetsp:Transcript_35789/g.78176  ORF Transcript_35789/g.78176 Transcript_35789/m.78176 type:complete len:484 (-) Transcript_35789:108-1559(-)|eukprot:CAMPEP_0204255844 /NCGR_PEP_ID=MMETSP0468-20130131/3441_1 /ASSEMBLY_ACC=CAM_ASM_000383 /TAXON_ID=2969 /ORGANISM="Oxyrrhis marina" /LENGTH=483 /DNA_ID=CAMNT_0051229755 /DNA_START=119 /DNA_END=1570 /DNA_ORIENTATION=-
MAVAPRRIVQDVVDDVGFGWFQVKSVVIGGGTYFADGAELLIIGAVTAMVAKEWNMEPWQKGAIVSIVFIGVMVGNFLSGGLGDYFGRRFPILLSYAGVFVFSVMSAYANSFLTLAFIRFFVGVSFGIGIPAWNTLCCEHCPTRLRTAMVGVGMMVFALGELYSACLLYADDPELRDLHWRWLVVMAAIPALLFFISGCYLLDESPSFLAITGRLDQAKGVLETAAWYNDYHGSLHFDVLEVDLAAQPNWFASTWHQLTIVFGMKYAWTTLTLMMSTFTLNFCYYGQLYALPQVLPDIDLPVQPAVSLMIGAVLEIPGFLLGIWIGQNYNRIPSLLGYLVATVLSLILFVLGCMILTGEMQVDGVLGTTSSAQIMVLSGLNANKIVISVGWLLVYLYSAEVFPGVCRVTGGAICIAAGRAGAILSPLIFEGLLSQYGTFTPYFVLSGVLSFLNIAFVVGLPFETKDRKLEEHEDEPITDSKTV